MSASVEYSSEQYEGKFNPKTYLESFYTTIEGNVHEDGLVDKLYFNHEFWSDVFQPAHSTPLGEVCCLDFGAGPAVVNMISAVPKVDYMVLAEFVKENRQSVSNWLEGKSGGHNWMPFFQHIVNDLEGNEGEEAIVKRRQELKGKIRSVVPCDVMKSPIVDLGVSNADKLFDAVFTSSCLENCVQSAEHYKSVVKSLVGYVKPGGYLIITGTLQQTFHFVGEEKFYSFYLTKSVVEEAMKEAGCYDVVIKTTRLKKTGVNSDGQQLLFCYARK